MNRILIIRFSSIGDLVLISPVIRLLRKKYPEAEIDLVTKKAFASLYQHHPDIQKVYSIEKSVTEISGELKKRNYDLLIDLHNNLRSHRLSAILKKPVLRFKKENIRKWRMVHLKEKKQVKHTVDRYIACLESLGIVSDGQGLEFYADPKSDLHRFRLPAGYSVFVTGGKFKTKCLPEEKMLALAALVSSPLVLVGGEEDRGLGEKMKALNPHIINLCGDCSFSESALIIRDAYKVLSHDTGFMHIACAYRKPLAVIWGNTMPGLGFSPYMPEQLKSTVTNFEVQNLSCRPCSKLGFASCPKKHFSCMQQQDVKSIGLWLNQA